MYLRKKSFLFNDCNVLSPECLLTDNNSQKELNDQDVKAGLITKCNTGNMSIQ